MKHSLTTLLMLVLFPFGFSNVIDFQPDELRSTNGQLDVTLNVDLVDSLPGIQWSSTGFRRAAGYNGKPIGPTLRVKPGDVITVTLNNNLDPPSALDRELVAYINDPNSDDVNTTIIYNRLDEIGNVYNPVYGFWGLNYNNLHFHGMDFSSKVENLGSYVGGGESNTLVLEVPADKESGLYWYHNHVHGTAAYSYLSSLYGMIIVEGTENDIDKAAGVEGAREIVMALSEGLVNPDGSVPPFFPIAMQFNWTGVTNGNIGEDTQFNLVQGDRVLFRVVSVSTEPPLTISIPGVTFVILAYDGLPLPKPRETDAVVIPAGGRVEFIARFDVAGTFEMTRAGWDIVPNEEACLAGFNIPVYPCISYDKETEVATFIVEEVADYVPPTTALIDTVELPEISDRLKFLAQQEPVDSKTVVLKQDTSFPLFQIPYDGDFVPPGVAFGINERLATPNYSEGNVTAGSCETWTVISDPPLGHPFHIHLAHFLVKAIDGVEQESPIWYDTVIIPNNNLTLHVCFDRAEADDTILVHCHSASHFDIGMGTFYKALAGPDEPCDFLCTVINTINSFWESILNFIRSIWLF